MPSRNVTQYRSVTQQVAKQTPDIAGSAAEIGTNILKAQQETKINDNLSKAQLEINDLTNRYRIDNESNPEANISEYQQARDEILNKYGEDISPLFKRQWQTQSNQIKLQTNADNQSWVYKQGAINAKNNINNSMLNNYNVSFVDGRNYATGDASDLSALWKFRNSQQDLANVSSKYLGKETVNQLMADYQKDYFKSFISGVIEQNPEKGLKLLENKEVQNQFDAIDIQDIKLVAEKRAKQVNAQKLMSNFNSSGLAFNMVNDPSTTIFEKKLKAQEMYNSGSIDSKTLSLLNANITSTANFNKEKNAQSVSELVLQIQALNNDEDKDGEEYLNGLNNVRNNIIDYQNKGLISADDAIIVNNSLNSISTTKKEAKALNDVSSDWGWGFDNDDAMDMFKSQMPNEQASFTAFRDYFYATSNKNYNSEERKKIAIGITRGLNKKRFAQEAKKQSNNIYFNSTEEAEKANLPKGTIVYINGRKARID